MTIRIIRNEAGNCVNFQGADTPVYWNSCLTALAHDTNPDNINIRNNIKSDGADAFEFFNEPFTSFVDANGDAFADVDACLSYINTAANAAGANSLNANYGGIWDTVTDITTDTSSYSNGDWFYVGVAATVTFDSVDYDLNVNDIVKFNATSSQWEVIRNANVSIAEIEGSALDQYDIHVDPSFTGDVRTGSSLQPYTDLAVAIANSNANDSILIKGEVIVPNSSSDAFVLPHGLEFYGNSKAVVRFASYDATNGDLFHFTGTDNTQKFLFEGLTIKYAGGYGIFTAKTARTEVRDSTLENNGWSGNGLNTVLPSSMTGVLGYDSAAVDLQAFYAGSEASNGGAMRIQEATMVMIGNNLVQKNLRGIRVQDCGIGGAGFITRNQAHQNIESGIYVAAGALGGCHNVVAAINSSAYNANNGLLVIGGINNKFSQIEVNGNWNAGVCGWGSANLTVRDCGLYDNNRSTYNGIGNTGDAKASIQINDAYNLLGTQITYNPDFRFIAEILDTQVHYTGLGSNTDRIGFLITSAVGAIADNDKNIIKVDDVGFIGQDYAIDFSEVDLTNLRVSLGDNSYQTIGQKAVKAPLAGNYSELPFSNHVMSVPEVDIVVDTLKQTIALHEGVGGNVINVYNMNELQSVLSGTKVDIIQRASDKIQLRGLTLGNVYINGVVAGTNLATMNDSMNAAFNMDLVEYKEFIETEVGVEGGGDSATFYYIESPDGVFHYPLFKTAAEANQVDTDLTGAGTSHTHTYADDTTGTTWYMPNVSNHMNASSAPVNGLYTAPNGESVSNVIWNIQPTDDDTNYVPTFTDITYTVQEGSAVNIQYKAAGMTDTFNLTNIPTGYADTGYAIVGTADEILDGVDIQHTINVTKANAFGSDTGTITLNVTDDPTNNVSANETPWTKALDFSGSNEHASKVSTWSGSNPIMMDSISQVLAGNSNSANTSNASNARPWATTIVFQSKNNTSNQHIWNLGEGAGSNDDNIYLRVTGVNGDLYFGWGRQGSVNECLIGNIGGSANASHWWGIYIASKGTRLSGSNATAANLVDCFDIRLMGSNDGPSAWAGLYDVNTEANWTAGSTGGRMDRSLTGSFTLGGRGSNRNFHGKIASMVVTTLRLGVAMPTDAEIRLMITDPKKWEDDYRVGQTVRRSQGSSNVTYANSSVYNGHGGTQIWLMGDGHLDSYANGMRNQVYHADQNYGKLQLNSMQSNDIQNVSITGLS